MPTLKCGRYSSLVTTLSQNEHFIADVAELGPAEETFCLSLAILWNCLKWELNRSGDLKVLKHLGQPSCTSEW